MESGTAVMCNIGIYGKVFRGFYASAFSLLGSATAYPAINSSAFYLDAFSSPVPVSYTHLTLPTTYSAENPVFPVL